MYPKNTNKVLLILLTFLSVYAVKAQTISNSPYSRFGIGEINPQGFARNAGMGYSGTSQPNGEFINIANPALLYYNRLTNLETGLVGQYKKLSDSNASQTDFNANLGYVAFAFPVNRFSSFSVGINPYSSVNYNITFREPIVNTEDFAQKNLTGTGGTNQAFIATGFNLGKGFTVGLQGSYIFGSVINQSSITIEPVIYNSTTNVVNTSRISDFIFKAGFAYRKEVRKESRVFFNTGFTYDIASNLNTTRTRYVSRIVLTGAEMDTLTNRQKGSTYLPATFKYGISFDRPRHWALAADVSYQPWQKYRGYDNLANYNANAVVFSAGGEWIPNSNNIGSDFGSYFSRVTYRAGINYGQMPISVNGNQLTDFGINFGISFPVNKNLSNINLSATLGQRGTTRDNLVKEQYIRFNLGFTLSDRWFIRGKID